MTKLPRKLIEVALPLEAINVASAREKSIRHGHPSTLHLWWARRPLAAARAVIFAQMLDDPSEHTDALLSDPAKKRAANRELVKRREAWEKRSAAYDEAIQAGNTGDSSPNVPAPGLEPSLEECIADIERERLFDIMRELVKWENTTNEKVLQSARDEIWRSWRYTCAANADHPQAKELFDRYKLPAFHDPFAGGGALPLEAQRLGLEAYASDLNPVAVLINKAMIEIPPKFAGKPPVNPEARRQMFGKDAEFRQEEQEEQHRRGGQDSQELQDVRSGGQDSQDLQDVRSGGQDSQDLEKEGLDSLSVPVTPVNPVSPDSLVLPVSPVIPVHSDGPGQSSVWRGAQGLAEDVRYYGQWMRDEAEKRIGHLYPKIEITAEMAQERPDLKKYVGQKLTVIAWLWARTVKSPNPAFGHIDVPLASTFMLSTKAGKEAYVEPVMLPSPSGRGGLAGGEGGYRFTVKVGKPKDAEAAKNGTKLARGANFRCLMSNTPMPHDYVRGEFQAKRGGERLMAIVAEGDRGRIYLSPTPEQDAVARGARPAWRPEQEMNQETSNLVSGRGYGITHWHEIFTPRQLLILTTLSDLVQESRERVKCDALAAGLPDDLRALSEDGTGATAYADAVCTYCGLSVDKCADYNSSLVVWSPTRDQAKSTFARQALPMVWDYAEVNPFANAAGDIMVSIEGIGKTLQNSVVITCGYARQQDASTQTISEGKTVSTDPPYYDNIGYADLSDFFYVWLRRSLRPIFPDLFVTLAVPKAEELVATPYRHGSKEKAETFFLDGMTQAMHRLAEQVHPAFPVTIYYAFKQSENDGDDGTSSTGWETFLDAVIRAGLAVTGTWPMRTERGSRTISIGTNALASSIVLVCRKRPIDAPAATRREFMSALKAELPIALTHLQRGNIAPVDLAQAAIGPGMAIFTRYAKVIDSTGKSMLVREALALINEILGEVLSEQEGDFDADSRWALAWFDQYGFDEGEFGVAETLSRAKNTSVNGMLTAGILTSGRGKVRLLRPDQLPPDWNPATDNRLTTWEIVHHLIRILESGGESKAAAMLAQLGAETEIARELCYRLYALCERKKRPAEALSYNGLVQSWPEMVVLARSGKADQPEQEQLL